MIECRVTAVVHTTHRCHYIYYKDVENVELKKNKGHSQKSFNPVQARSGGGDSLSLDPLLPAVFENYYVK